MTAGLALVAVVAVVAVLVLVFNGAPDRTGRTDI